MPLKLTRPLVRVTERLLGLVGTPLPTEPEQRIGLSVEMRAAADRPWEMFDERIYRWQIRVSQPAIVGQFSAVTVAGISATPDNNGALWTVDIVRYFSVASGVILLNTAGIGGIPTSISASWLDRRIALATVPVPLAIARGQHTGVGTIIEDTLASANQLFDYPVGYVSSFEPGTALNQQDLTVSGLTVNTAIFVMLRGRIIFPR